MAFGGLSPHDGRKKYSGKFFLDITSKEPSDRVTFISKKDIQSKDLNTPASCISKGLIPFEYDSSKYEDLDSQWMFYSGAISQSEFYPNSNLPSKDELTQRLEIIQSAFKGIINTTIAVYTVPKKYDLGTICEIFETLNTTGTKVSTVDLIHSTLYAETQRLDNPINLREWLKDLSQMNGAIGWSDPNDRPELIAQCVTSCYLSLINPPAAKNVGGKSKRIDSIKSGDLLATPTTHWQHIVQETDSFVHFLQDFQIATVGFSFPYRSSPYPVLSSIYMGLRWTNKFDNRGWDKEKIDSLFKSFFWRTALSSRYDQGFLTKQFQDLKDLEKILSTKTSNHSEWLTIANTGLDKIFGGAPVELEILKKEVLDHRPSGAMAKAIHLAIRSSAKQDFLDPQKSTTSFFSNEVDLHHIFPKDWIKNNVNVNDLERYALEGKGGVNCIANLTPMIRQSNLNWRANTPSIALQKNQITYQKFQKASDGHFVDEFCFSILEKTNSNFLDFWNRRAELISTHLAAYQVISS